MKDDSLWDGARLRTLRDQAELTQTELAERIGVKRDAVARWERNDREPSYTNIVKLVDALKVSCEAFRKTAETPGEK